jgi:hypothetical protein
MGFFRAYCSSSSSSQEVPAISEVHRIWLEEGNLLFHIPGQFLLELLVT